MKEIILEDNPDVSIVLPVYNEAKYLAATLDSLCKQSYRNFELIIVDDGSTDDSRRVMDHFSFDRRIKFIDKPHGGRGDALNVGHKAARGKLLTWALPGNVYYNMFLEILRVSLIQAEIQKKATEFVYGDFQFVDEQGNGRQNIVHQKIEDKESLKNGCSIGPSFMYTRNLWEQTGEYWDRPAENYQWCVRAAQYTDFGLVNAMLAGVIIRPNSDAQDPQAIEDCRELARNLFEEVTQS